jgi:predicted O-methyltransferase YrrM
MRYGTHTLHDLVARHGWTRGAEIGVYQGKTTFYLLDRRPELTLYAVDSWPPDAQWRPPPAPRRDMRKIGVEFARTAEAAGHWGGRLIVLHGPSVDMADRVEDGSLDFVFIDADHSKPAVLADIAAWAPKVRSGGAVLGHDVHLESVRDAVRQVYGDAYDTYPHDVWGVPKS